MAEASFDLIIIGAGPGGYVAAIRAAQLGKKVAVVEERHLGGICLNWGCIPTKALLRSAEVFDLMTHAETFGLRASKPSFDLKKIVDRSRSIADQLSKGIQHLFKKNKVTHFNGRGAFEAKTGGLFKISVTKDGQLAAMLTASKVVLASGARARVLLGLEPDGKNIWTYREAMVPDVFPKSLLVVGSGAIGIEFASFYRSLGSEVTVVEVLDRILPNEDEEISSLAQKAFEKRDIKIETATTVASLKSGKSGVRVTFKTPKGQEEGEFDKVILAVGIQANTENMGLEKVKVKLEKGHVAVNDFCETTEPGLYAIGDVAGAPWLAHKASHEGVIAIEHMFGQKEVHSMKRTSIPGCTYSSPQIASLGFTEKQAKEKGHEIKVGRFPFLGNGKAIALGEPEGLVKTIYDAKTGELLGAHMIGAEVTELIQGFAVAKACEATEAEVMQTIFPHPTLSEMMHESTLQAFGRAIHI